MMRRLICIMVGVFVLMAAMPACLIETALADDYSIYTTEYLLQMRSEIDAELARRGVSENTPLESGNDFHDKYNDRIAEYNNVRYEIKYMYLIEKYAEEYNLNPSLVASIIRNESSFRETAESAAGARGLMQLTQNLAEWIKEKLNVENYSFDMMFDPETNIRFGCWFLNNLGNVFGGNSVCVISAYHSGQGAVKSWLADYNVSEDGITLIPEKIPYSDTAAYVKRIIRDCEAYQTLFFSDNTVDISFSNSIWASMPILREGSLGQNVDEIQRRLVELYYLDINLVDGQFGPATKEAVIAFQQANNLEANGIVDETTRKILFSPNAIPKEIDNGDPLTLEEHMKLVEDQIDNNIEDEIIDLNDLFG